MKYEAVGSTVLSCAVVNEQFVWAVVSAGLTPAAARREAERLNGRRPMTRNERRAMWLPASGKGL